MKTRVVHALKKVTPVEGLPVVGGIRTGGRSARVVDDVLTATAEELGRVGYGALRVEDVAVRSGVNKTTIYRRWATKSQLVAAALQQHKVLVAAEDSGDLERDLVKMFECSLQAFNGEVMRGIVRMIQTEKGDPEVDAIIADLRESTTRIRRQRVDLAVDRGELPARTDVLFLVQLLSSSVYSRVVNFSEAVTPEYIEDVVRIIIAGARTRYR